MDDSNDPASESTSDVRLTRRAALATIAAGAVGAALPARGENPGAAGSADAAASMAPACRDPHLIPNMVVTTHEGRRAWFLDDLLAKRAVLLHFTSEEAERQYPVLDGIARVRALLAERMGERMGEAALVISICTDVDASPHALAKLAERHGVGRGWLFVSAEPRELAALQGRFFAHSHAAGHVATNSEDCSRGLLRYGNASLGLWGSVAAKADPAQIADRLSWVTPPAADAGRNSAPRRRGPVAGALLLALALATSAVPCAAQTAATPQPRRELEAETRDQCQLPPHPYVETGACVGQGHPRPQPQLKDRTQFTANGTTTATTGTSLFAPSSPFRDPPGTNLLPNVYTNAYDSNCDEIPNTLPSTPTVYYNLHDGEPVVSRIDRTSPTTDLERILDRLDAVTARRRVDDEGARTAKTDIAMAIDILEGNPIPNRTYSGFPLLHYKGPDKFRKVTATYDAQGKVTGGNVDIHQIWYDNHVESDVYLLDPTAVAEVPWTITYTLDVLDRGKDDFSPFVAYFDAPPPGAFEAGRFGPLLIGMDQTFFPIEEGTRTLLEIKMAPGKYFSLSYTWGWRWHPPRIQVLENATKKVGTTTAAPMTLLDWERSVFGNKSKADAIAMIGDLAPAKRMWKAFGQARDAAQDGDWDHVALAASEARLAFQDWQDRTRLPRGVPLDKSADMTLFYVNNTMYAQFTDGGSINFPKYQTRGAKLTVALVNGDYFDHAYTNIDFGGARGWENQFKSSVKVGGSGCWFTFGRNYPAENLCKPVTVPAAVRVPPVHLGSSELGSSLPDGLGRHRVEITFASDPSRRLRFYQFDPTHHDVAIMSIH